MKTNIPLLCVIATLLVGCEAKVNTAPGPTVEKKETTVVNPPEKKVENNTTIVNPPEKK